MNNINIERFIKIHFIRTQMPERFGGFMIRKNSTVLVLSLLLLTGIQGYTQDVLTLSVEQAVDLALEQNPDVQIARKEVAKAKAAVWEAWSVLLPDISANANFQHSWDIQTNVIPNFLKPMLAPLAPMIPELALMPDFVELSFGLENTFMYGANLTQPVFLGGAGIAGVQMAKSGQRASEHQLESKKQNLIFQTVNAFYGTLLAKELVDVQEVALEQSVANFDVVRKKYEAGTASGFDKMRAEVQVANLKPDVITARNNYQSALTGLRTILGLPKDQEVAVQGELTFSAEELDGISLQVVQEKAATARPELAAFTEQRTIASKGVTLARAQFLPKLFFSTDYSFLAMKNDYNFTQDDFSKGFTSAISLQIPLFQGFKRAKQYQKAQLDYNIVLDTEKSLQDGINAEVEIAYNKYGEAKEKYFSAQESIGLAEESFRLAQLMYEEGASTQLDVMSAQLALTRAKLNYASALYEYQMSRYALRRASGTLKGVL